MLMVRLTKIYTRSGDDGSTALGDFSRVAKTHPRIEAYGDVDELGAVVGMAILHCDDAKLEASLIRIQNDLFDVGADLCVPLADTEEDGSRLRIVTSQVDRLEKEIDDMNADLPALTSFVLAGGSPLSSHLHLARCVARRCERRVLRLAADETVNDEARKYLNRLSDHLFVMARYANKASGEVLWKPGDQR